jgi:hypothetical protein
MSVGCFFLVFTSMVDTESLPALAGAPFTAAGRLIPPNDARAFRQTRPAAPVSVRAHWAVDLLQEAGFEVHLAHPSGNDWGNRRVKNNERDARDLADLLRLGRLAEAWIAPPAVPEVRELLRYRAKLVQLRSGLKTQVHAVMAKEGVLPSMTDMFCQAGQRELDRMELADVYVILTARNCDPLLLPDFRYPHSPPGRTPWFYAQRRAAAPDLRLDVPTRPAAVGGRCLSSE